MPDRGPFPVPASTDIYPSRDKSFRQDFAAPLAKNNSSLGYAGYRRALELYGNENLLLGAAKAHHFRRWIRNNREIHASHRTRAEHEGYSPDQGFVELLGERAIYHYYNPNDSRHSDAVVAATYPSEPEEFPPATPRAAPANMPSRPTTRQASRRRISSITVNDSDEDNMPPGSQVRDGRGRFAADLPQALTRMDGLRAPDENNFPGTCVGNAELCSIFAELLERQYGAKTDEEVRAI